MGTKEKEFMKKASAHSSLSPLEGGSGLKLPVWQMLDNAATVLYIGRILHGFYEKEIEGFFGQLGTVKRLRIAENKKLISLLDTLQKGKSRHFGFIEFKSPEGATIVAETMHNYLLAEHLLQVHLIPPEHVHPKVWRGFNIRYKPLDCVQIQRKEHNRERTLKEHMKLLEGIIKRDKKWRKRIEAAGIEYECPEIVGSAQPVPKKTKFDED